MKGSYQNGIGASTVSFANVGFRGWTGVNMFLFGVAVQNSQSSSERGPKIASIWDRSWVKLSHGFMAEHTTVESEL